VVRSALQDETKILYLDTNDKKIQCGQITNYVGFEVHTAVVMKSSAFWDISPCSPLKATDLSEEHVASIFKIEE
jgi:hypothetical protein